MASRDRIAGGGYRGADDLDAYLRNEYRAEEGAYLERRPAYARYTRSERVPPFWEPRLPSGYYREESFTRSGMMPPHDELPRQDETRFEKRHAEDIAEAVSGVTHVQNNLRVRSS